MKMALYVLVYMILIFIFSPGLSVSMCTLRVMQPEQFLHGKFNQSISITCDINTTCRNKQVQWYVFMTDFYYQLDINNHQGKYKLQGTDLHINWLSYRDEGVYYCSAFDEHSTNSGAQDIGTGTTLTVKENGYSAGEVLLFTLVALLFICNIIILILFIFIKNGRVTLFKGSQSQSQVMDDSTRRVHFRAVVQELYSKRNLRRNKKNTFTETAQKNKVEKPRTHRGKEDIYQNLKRA